jgi:hypothetical protein
MRSSVLLPAHSLYIVQNWMLGTMKCRNCFGRTRYLGLRLHAAVTERAMERVTFDCDHSQLGLEVGSAGVLAPPSAALSYVDHFRSRRRVVAVPGRPHLQTKLRMIAVEGHSLHRPKSHLVRHTARARVMISKQKEPNPSRVLCRAGNGHNSHCKFLCAIETRCREQCD